MDVEDDLPPVRRPTDIRTRRDAELAIDWIRRDHQDLETFSAYYWVPLDATLLSKLTEAMLVNSHVRYLYIGLAENSLGTPLEDFIRRVATSHPSLILLDVRAVRFRLPLQTARMLGSSLRSSSLMTLRIRNIVFEPQAFQALLAGLNGNQVLGNHVGPAGAEALAAALPRCSLVSLKIENCDFDVVQFIRPLFSALSNLRLVFLIITMSKIGDEEVKEAIVPMLRRNDTLNWLGLERNNISNEGAAALRDVIRHANFSLSYLNLDRQLEEIDPALIDEIQELCRVNDTSRRIFHRAERGRAALSLSPGLLPRVLALVATKPDLVYRVLKLSSAWIPGASENARGRPHEEPAAAGEEGGSE